MEKLIELLNEFWEYDLVEHKWEICKWTTDDETGEINIYTDYTNNIISKQFWFIKWLVENDKIKDLEEIDYIYWPELVNHQTEIIYTPYSLYNSLLMLLSISSSPIDDLISYLK